MRLGGRRTGTTWHRIAALWLVVALAAAAVELSQLWHPVWLEAMRAHPTILLLIGQTFDPYDWVSCGLGLIMGMAIERKFQ